uniref:TERF1-interacting nuclear factor 2 N-terminal domain-containing protein n=1 Tax=Astatotilapia calliptera TaxID=8154 RepID=A0A3P8NNE5_ASTCA
PLRLLTAAMWQVARHEMVRHYGMLEDFVSLVTEAVPQLLTDRQRCLLLLALRAKVGVLQGENFLFVSRLFSQQLDEDVSESATLNYQLHTKFDSALQSLISDFLSRIEQLFPVPDFKQAASWFDAAPSGLEDCLQKADKDDLRELLTNQTCLQGQSLATESSELENQNQNQNQNTLLIPGGNYFNYYLII